MGKYIALILVTVFVGGIIYAIATGNMGGARNATANYIKVRG